MNKIVDITDILVIKRAITILETLNMQYDYEMLRKRPELCKQIVALFEDDAEEVGKHKVKD